jgi:hypothetical protein
MAAPLMPVNVLLEWKEKDKFVEDTMLCPIDLQYKIGELNKEIAEKKGIPYDPRMRSTLTVHDKDKNGTNRSREFYSTESQDSLLRKFGPGSPAFRTLPE